MNWHFRKLKYDILIPKLDKNLFKLTEEETAAYFEWFMQQVPGRVEYVSQVCAKEGYHPFSGRYPFLMAGDTIGEDFMAPNYYQATVTII